ncbi:MAG: hypothetical protein CSA50_04010 [Gammaproteobacteria bacterium]|nr:MAG: hypothetical protein CSA50_04010 [Gammaproteobacteria bacterium]
MDIAKCQCGAIPTLETSPKRFNHWDVFCFNCGKQSTNHPSKYDAVRAWNLMTETATDFKYSQAG